MPRTLGWLSRGASESPELILLPVSLLLLYLLLFIRPALPIYYPGDSSVYLLNARRMLDGQIIYRDFFQFTLPGTELFYVGFFKVFGPRLWIPNVTLIVLGLGLSWVMLQISRCVIPGAAALLPSLTFLTCVYWVWLDPSHHWFSTLLVMGAVTVILNQRTGMRLTCAGGLCALASFFTQAKGAAAVLGIAGFLLWEHFRRREGWSALLKRQVYLLGPFACVLTGISAHYARQAGLGRFLFCTVGFGLKYYRSEWSNNLKVYFTGLPTGTHWYTAGLKLGMFAFIHGLVPLIYVLFLMRYRHQRAERPNEPWTVLMLIGCVGLALFLGVAAAPAWTRLCAVSPPAVILLVWFLNSSRGYACYLLKGLWLGVAFLAIAEPWHEQHRWRAVLKAGPGEVACIYPTLCEEYRWIMDHTRPGEYFLRAVWPDCYFLLDLRSPATVPFLTTTDYLRPEQVRALIESLDEHQVRYVLWSATLDVRDPRNSSEDHLGPVRSYLDSYYHVVKTFPAADGDQVWERNP